MPSDLETLPLAELRSLVEALIGDPMVPRTQMQRVKLMAFSAEVLRRLDESDDAAEGAALQALADTLDRWLDDNRRLGRDDDDDDRFSGTCMCSTARVMH